MYIWGQQQSFLFNKFAWHVIVIIIVWTVHAGYIRVASWFLLPLCQFCLWQLLWYNRDLPARWSLPLKYILHTLGMPLLSFSHGTLLSKHTRPKSTCGKMITRWQAWYVAEQICSYLFSILFRVSQSPFLCELLRRFHCVKFEAAGNSTSYHKAAGYFHFAVVEGADTFTFALACLYLRSLLTGLKANTKYRWSVGDILDGYSDSHHFYTQPSPSHSQKTNFIQIGDMVSLVYLNWRSFTADCRYWPSARTMPLSLVSRSWWTFLGMWEQRSHRSEHAKWSRWRRHKLYCAVSQQDRTEIIRWWIFSSVGDFGYGDDRSADVYEASWNYYFERVRTHCDFDGVTKSETTRLSFSMSLYLQTMTALASKNNVEYSVHDLSG